MPYRTFYYRPIFHFYASAPAPLVAAGKLENRLRYTGKELQHGEFTDGTGLEEYDMAARYYDPQLGRWTTQDPAGQFASPYLGMGNNWPNGTDHNGKWFGWDDAIVSAVGFVVGYVGYGLEKGDWGGKALLTGLTGAAVAEGGYLTLGGGLAASSAAGVGGTGSIASAGSFAFSYGISDATSLYTNRQQIHDATGWGAFGLITGYSFLSSLKAGFSSEYTGDKIDTYLDHADVPADNSPFTSLKDAWSSAIGGFIY